MIQTVIKVPGLWFIIPENLIGLDKVQFTASLLKHVDTRVEMPRRGNQGKPGFCMCENKGADQLCNNCTADQRICLRYTDSTISLLLKPEISSF